MAKSDSIVVNCHFVLYHFSFRNSPAACDSGGGDDSDSEDSGSGDSDSDDSDSDGSGSGDGGGRDGSGSGGGGSGGGGSRGDEEKVLEKLPERAVQLALKAGEAYLASMYHDDIEKSEVHLVSILASPHS